MPGQPDHPLIDDETNLTSEQLSILFNGKELLKAKSLGRVTFKRVGYLRISKDRQRGKRGPGGGQAKAGLGVTRQYKGICKKCPEPIEFWYIDNDTSAWSGVDRPDYINMCNDIRSGVVHPDGEVWAYFTDRLNRSTQEGLEFVELCYDYKKHKHGRDITVHIAQSGVQNFHTGDGRKAFIESSVAAEHYSWLVSEKARDKMDEKAENGEPLNGKKKFGFKVGGVEHEPLEAEAIRRGAKMVLAGRSLSAVAKDWNDHDLRTPTKGNLVNINTVRLALTRESTTGLLVHRGVVVGEGDWKPILDRNTWTAVRAALAGNAQKSWQTQGSKVRWLGTSLYRCGACGDVMYVSGGAYKCKAKRPEREPDGKVHASRVAKTLDNMIGALLLAKLMSEDVATDLVERDAPVDVDVADLLARRAELDTQIAAYRSFVGQPGWGPIEVNDAVGKLAAMQADIDQELGTPTTPSLAAEFVADGVTEEAWDATPIDGKRAILSELATVTVNRSPRGLHRSTTEFLTIDWHI